MSRTSNGGLTELSAEGSQRRSNGDFRSRFCCSSQVSLEKYLKQPLKNHPKKAMFLLMGKNDPE